MNSQILNDKAIQMTGQYARAKRILFGHFIAFLIFELAMVTLANVMPQWNQQFGISILSIAILWPIAFAIHWFYVYRTLINRMDKQLGGFMTIERTMQTQTSETYLIWHMLIFAIFVFPTMLAVTAIFKTNPQNGSSWFMLAWPIVMLIHVIVYVSNTHRRNNSSSKRIQAFISSSRPDTVAAEMTAPPINLPDASPVFKPSPGQTTPPVTEPASARYGFTQTDYKKGGMATIRLAIDHKDHDRQVIIKSPRCDTEHSAQLNAEKLLQETDYLRKVSHPNIVKFIDSFYDQDKMPNLVVEYIDGGDLLNKYKFASADEQMAVKSCRQILDALEYIHSSGFIHRDLNPGNIMVKTSGDVTLIDFGTVKESGYSSDTVFFKPGFVIPEVSAKGYADKRSDIYGVGSTLYYMLTCERPGFIKERDVVSLLIEKGISQRTAKCVDQALQLDPNFRFQSADAMRRALMGG